MKQLINDWMNKIWNEKNLDAINELVDPGVEIHSPLEILQGKDRLRDIFSNWLIAFPDMRVTNTNWLVNSDTIAVQWKAEVTHLGKFKDIEPTGKKARYEGVTLYTFNDNMKVVAYRCYMDLHDLLEQLRK